MSAPFERKMKLMAFADGELDGAERAEVEAWLSGDADARRFVRDLGSLGDVVRLTHEGGESARATAAFDVADAVMARIAPVAEALPIPAVSTTPAPVASLDAARAARQSYARVGAATLATFALAASVLLFVRTEEEPLVAAGRAAEVDALAAVESGPGVDVDVDETSGQMVSVFYLPNESSLTTSLVVWVDEIGDK